MKNIEDATAWLKEFMETLNSQDNRITATPYYYTLRCPIRVVGTDNDYSEGCVWVDYDSEEIGDDEALKNYLWSIWEEDPNETLWGIKTKEEITDELAEDLAINGLRMRQVNYHTSVEYKGFFLTEKACLAHLESNKHHYPEGTDTCLDHAYRNPELRQLLENIGTLVGVEYERK